MREENWRRGFWPTAIGGISLPAVGWRTSSSVPPLFGLYPNLNSDVNELSAQCGQGKADKCSKILPSQGGGR